MFGTQTSKHDQLSVDTLLQNMSIYKKFYHIDVIELISSIDIYSNLHNL